MAADETGFIVSVEFDDPRFKEAIENPDKMLPLMKDAVEQIMAFWVSKMVDYPPETDANRPGRTKQDGSPMGYYERGVGWWEPNRLHHGAFKKTPLLQLPLSALEAGGAGAFGGASGYRLTTYSEQMGQQWQYEAYESDKGAEAEGINVASYSAFVQGLIQTELHRAREWQNVEDVWNTDEVQNYVDETCMGAIDAFFGA